MFAAIREKLLSGSRRPMNRRVKPAASRTRLGIEALEERAMLSTSPLVFATTNGIITNNALTSQADAKPHVSEIPVIKVTDAASNAPLTQ